ncbi:MAG TPA: YdcF family protein [bacterium]|nr:YdcF family protein [bacterium]
MTKPLLPRIAAGLAALAAAAVLVWVGLLWREFLGSLETPPAPLAHSDAIVTLAGGAGRLDRGLDLLQEGKAEVLLLSGTGSGIPLRDIYPDRDLSALRSGQVILLESRSTSTYENAIEAWAVLASRGPVRDVVLLTSNYHMLRATWCFRKVFPANVVIRPVPVVAENVEPGKWWRDGRARKVVLNEFAKYVWYRVRYADFV